MELQHDEGAIMEKKLKHLEFIQQAINRMASNLFLLKGWTVTLIAAMFALAAKESREFYFVLAYLPTLMFWLLDGYFRFLHGHSALQENPTSKQMVARCVRVDLAHLLRSTDGGNDNRVVGNTIARAAYGQGTRLLQFSLWQ